jgi:OMF family outer membrane factor
VQLTKPITLQQALALAQRNNRDLQTAILTQERSQFALREAVAAEYPTLGLQTDVSRSDSANAELSNRRSPLGGQSLTSTTLNGVLALNYDVYTSGRRSATIRAAAEQARFDELDVERQSEQIRLDVTNAYYDLQQADAQVTIGEASVSEAQRSLRDAQLLERAGLGTEFDILRAQVQVSDANQTLTTARSQQSFARRRLVQLLSLAQTVEVKAADPIQPAGSWQLSLPQTIILALQNRAELQQQLARRNISQQQQIVALASERPQVNVFANYNLLDLYNDGTGPADGLSLGARLRWDFYDGGAARARAAQQRVNIAIAENQFADARNQVRLQVEQAYFNLNSNRENIQTAELALQQALRSLQLARLRFNAGVGNQTDVINAQSELTRARANRLQAIVDYNRSLASLQRAISNLSPRTVVNRS